MTVWRGSYGNRYGAWRALAAAFMMRGCGLRRGEALAVESSWFQNGKLRVHQQQLSDSSHGPFKSRKPGEFRDVPTPQYVLNAVAGPGDGYLFHIPTRTFCTEFRKAADHAGLEGFTAHDLRHMFASSALARGVPITDVAKFLGHRNIQVTSRPSALHLA